MTAHAERLGWVTLFAVKRRTAIAMAWLLAVAAPANGQSQPAEQGTRAGAIADQQREKAKDLKVYEPNEAEIWVRQLEELLTGGTMRWHPFFDSAYRGGGLLVLCRAASSLTRPRLACQNSTSFW